MILARQRVMGEMEAPVGRPVQTLDRAAQTGNDVVRPTAHEQAAVHGFVMHGVDAHHAHHQADPGDDPRVPPVDRLADRDECGVQQHRLAQHQGDARRAALRDVDSRAPLTHLGWNGEPWESAVVGDCWGQFSGHWVQTL